MLPWWQWALQTGLQRRRCTRRTFRFNAFSEALPFAPRLTLILSPPYAPRETGTALPNVVPVLRVIIFANQFPSPLTRGCRLVHPRCDLCILTDGSHDPVWNLVEVEVSFGS